MICRTLVNRFAFGVAIAALLLSGCSTVTNYLGAEANTTPPAELPDITPQVKVFELWSHSVGAGPEDLFLKLNAVVTAGRVFAADRKGRVSAFDAVSGDLLWRTNTKKPIGGGPGSGSGVVVVGTRNGDVLALSPVDGALLWKSRVSSEVLSSPKASDGIVVVRTIDGKLFGFSAIDGERLWIYDRGVPSLSLRGTSAPVIASGVAVAGFDGGRLVGIQLKTGRPLWETLVALPTGRSEFDRMVDIDGTIAIGDQTVYVVTFQGRTAAVDLFSGTILWRRDMSSHAGIGLDETAVYVTDEESHVWALDRTNSASIWRQTGLEGRNLTPPVRFKDFIVVGDFDGYIHCLRRDDGQFVGRIRVDSDGIIAAPVATDDVLYVYGRGGTLAALQIE